MEINTELIEQYPWATTWDLRAEKISKFIKKNSRVLDLGGGIGNLYNFLESPDYVSIDLKPWTNKTIVADLNKEFPNFEKRFDVVVCQGILEYIKEPEIFLRKIRKYSQKLIISYRLNVDNSNVMERNNLTFKEIKKLLTKTNWRIKKEEETSENQKIFVCKWM